MMAVEVRHNVSGFAVPRFEMLEQDNRRGVVVGCKNEGVVEPNSSSLDSRKLAKLKPSL